MVQGRVSFLGEKFRGTTLVASRYSDNGLTRLGLLPFRVSAKSSPVIAGS